MKTLIAILTLVTLTTGCSSTTSSFSEALGDALVAASNTSTSYTSTYDQSGTVIVSGNWIPYTTNWWAGDVPHSSKGFACADSHNLIIAFIDHIDFRVQYTQLTVSITVNSFVYQCTFY